MNLIDKIKSLKANVGIIGLGYVGLPLAVEFAKTGFNVTGIDISKDVVNYVNKGKSYINDISDEQLKEVIKSGKLRATTDFSVIKKLDTLNICVPTPLRKSKDPDVSFIIAAITEIKKYIKKGQLIILESTTYPGTTEEVVKPILEETGLKVGKDFHLGFSPERVDPGNEFYNTKNTPKVVGGTTGKCTKAAAALYEQSIQTVIPVGSTQTAELVKLLENTFRAVNIGLVNEIALMCDKLKIDVWEVIEAAATKPFGFMPFYPGPGLGGHCIPIDPLYLSWKAKFYNFTARFIELADEINSMMPDYVISKIMSSLNSFKKCINGSKILVLGVAYKADISDTRESPSIQIVKKLQERKANIIINDPYVNTIKINNKTYKSKKINDALLKKADCVVITTNHSNYDLKYICRQANLIVDTRNATKNIKRCKAKVIKI